MKKRPGILAVVVLGALFAAAKAQPPRAPDNPLVTKSFAVDVLEEKLRKAPKPKNVLALKRAFDALKGTKYATARKLAEPLLGDATYADYGYWISGCASEGEALQAYRTKGYKTAVEAAKKAVALLEQVHRQNAYSPLQSLTQKNLGRSEVALGDSYVKLKKWKLAYPAYEAGFEILHSNNSLFALTPESLANYSTGCQKSASELCPLWIERFLTINHRTSAEYRAVADNFPPESLPGARMAPLRVPPRLITRRIWIRSPSTRR